MNYCFSFFQFSNLESLVYVTGIFLLYLYILQILLNLNSFLKIMLKCMTSFTLALSYSICEIRDLIWELHVFLEHN